MIRTSSISLKTTNANKKLALLEFLQEFQKAVQFVIDEVWENGYSSKDKAFNISKDELDLPLYLDYKRFDYKEPLSARAFCSATEQALGILKSAVQKRKQLLWVLNKLQSQSKSTSYIEEQLSKYGLVKPKITELKAELSSKCIDFRETKESKFDMFIRLRYTGFDPIKFPISISPKFRKRKHQDWKTLGGVALYPDRIEIYQEKIAPKQKVRGKIIGCDTGILSTVTMSDGQTSATDNYGHNLSTITKKMSRQKKGSKAFERSVSHRKNYINWTVNQLNLSGIKQINLESINTFNGGGKSRQLSHFAHSLIEQKLTDFAEEHGVRIELQTCTYKSQRCSHCGFVFRKNRKGKRYDCKHCGASLDADSNSAINNSLSLPKISSYVKSLSLNRKDGFFWNLSGLFDLNGRELRVPDEYEENRNKDKLL